MKKKHLTVLVIVLAVILAAGVGLSILMARGNDQSQDTQPTTAATAQTAPTTEASAAPTEEPTTVPTTEPPVLYTNPLTGEAVDAPIQTRIFTCTISNVIAALPTYGVNDSDIFWEMLVNGGATRGLAMYADVTKAGEIGSIRSARYNFVDICEAYDAVLAYAGGSDYVINKIYNCGIAHLNDNGVYFYRHNDRLYGGYDWEHCLSTNGPALLEYAESWEYRTATEREDYGLVFAEGATPQGEDATDIYFEFWNNTRNMIYNAETGKYEYWMYGEEATDFFTHDPISFKNVLLLQMVVYNDDIYHVAAMDGSGVGYYACNGKIIPIQWHHENELEPFTFTLMDGTPLVMDVGNSYIGFVPEDDTIEW